MPVKYFQDEKHPDTLHVILEKPYTWEAYIQLAKHVPEIIKTYNTRYIIIDSTGGFPEGNLFLYGRRALSIVNQLQQIRYIISLNREGNPMVIRLIRTLLRISMVNPERYPIFQTEQEALALIAADRNANKKTPPSEMPS